MNFVEVAPDEPKTRKPRSVKADKKDSGKALETLTSAITTVHVMLASLTKIEELAITEPESAAIASAINDVTTAYDITPSPQTQALVNLAVIVAGVYGMRLYAYKTRIADEQAKKEADKLAEKESEDDSYGNAV